MITVDWIEFFKSYHPFGIHAVGNYDWGNTTPRGGDDQVFIVPVKWELKWSWEVFTVDPWFKKMKYD